MPLDSRTQALLENFHGGAAAAVAVATSVTERRHASDAYMTAIWDAIGLQPVAEIGERFIPGRDGAAVRIRFYRPDRSGLLPVYVWIHGGAFSAGSLDMYEYQCRATANAVDALVVSVDYRLAPEYRFPQGFDDCWSALQWVTTHALELGGDARRIAIGGESAGAALTAATCLRARDEAGPALALQVLEIPVLDSSCGTPSMREFDPTGAMRTMWDTYLPPDTERDNPYASPAHATDLGGLPPAIIITAECDAFRDEGEAYGLRLKEAGVPTVVTRILGTAHMIFAGTPTLDAARHAREAIAHTALRAALGHGGSG